MNKKRLYKSTKDQKLSGVLAGVADYFGIDPAITRIGFIVLALGTVVIPCVIGYLLAAWVLPKDTEI
ncbi:MAG TPA: PspC domain-containing protein [Bacillus sp. (in: firmicutes)]|uniref:PspC domain-containing protein n=1 Tax=Bacillus litorisediminis TaxID=2922713 RepID=UPI001FAC56D7|nr:PspC domain-containing protein [Bacillus litorisediminis]HWO76730.1 PspC domain-containing protein [Bacillus sp. (in: firmicutes)]